MRWWLLLSVLAASCGAKDPCADVPCSSGRVCVVKGTDKVACDAVDGGTP
ncbi:MAG: hypothetical protein U0228_16060 [Myxococcaceae bacterium]